jgi:hypothetical protein
MAEQIISKVWRLAGLIGKVEAGALVWDGGHILYITADGIVFNEPLSAITAIKWPFLRMGLGFDAVVKDTKYKFSFSKPNHSAPDIDIIPGKPYPSVNFAGQFSYDMSSLVTIKTDKATTKKWKELLAGK